jgi:hypothetical protein
LTNQRARLLRAALGFASLDSADAELRPLRRWLDSWSGVGYVIAGMARQEYDLELRRYNGRGWRAVFFPSSYEHSFNPSGSRSRRLKGGPLMEDRNAGDGNITFAHRGAIISVAGRRPAQPPSTFRSGPPQREPREHQARGSHRWRGRAYALPGNPGTMRRGTPSVRHGQRLTRRDDTHRRWKSGIRPWSTGGAWRLADTRRRETTHLRIVRQADSAN